MKLYDNDEYRNTFMDLVYDLLRSDGTNDRANLIIDAFDAVPAVEAEPILPNDLLTLDELREMDGEPVYVRYLGGGGEWGLVETMYGYDHIEIRLRNGLTNVSSKYGLLSRGASIYRRKPEVEEKI